jgi:hypothetical protein
MTNVMKVLALLALLTTSGCLRDELPVDGIVCVQDGTSTATTVALEEAVLTWAHVSDRKINLSIALGTDGNCDAILADGMVGTPTDNVDGECEWKIIGDPEITIDIFASHPRNLPMVIGHELGHAMGADHIDAPNATMNAVGNVTHNWPPTAADVAEVLN